MLCAANDAPIFTYKYYEKSNCTTLVYLRRGLVIQQENGKQYGTSEFKPWRNMSYMDPSQVVRVACGEPPQTVD